MVNRICENLDTKELIYFHGFDRQKMLLTFTTSNDIIQVGKYNLTGKVLTFPVYGSGDVENNLFGATLHHTVSFKENMKRGTMHFKVDSYSLRVQIKNGHFQFDNLFNGDKALGDTILKAINDNPLLIFDDIRSGFESSYGLIFKTLAQQLFDKIPANELFPEIK